MLTGEEITVLGKLCIDSSERDNAHRIGVKAYVFSRYINFDYADPEAIRGYKDADCVEIYRTLRKKLA